MAAERLRLHALFLMEVSDAMKKAFLDVAFCRAMIITLVLSLWPSHDSSSNLQEQHNHYHCDCCRCSAGRHCYNFLLLATVRTCLSRPWPLNAFWLFLYFYWIICDSRQFYEKLPSCCLSLQGDGSNFATIQR